MPTQERNEGEGGHNASGAKSVRGAETFQQCRKCFQYSLLLKGLRFEYGGAKLVSCPGRHLTSERFRVHHSTCYLVVNMGVARDT